MKIALNSNNYFVFLFLLAILMPTFYNYFGNAGSILVNGLLIVFITIFLALTQGSKIIFNCKKSKKIALIYLIPLVLFLILQPLSMAIGVWNGTSLIERDFFEFYKPLLYLLIFIFVYLHFSANDQVIVFQRLLIMVFIFVLLLGLNQFFRLYDPLTEFYTKPLNISTGRVSAPFKNPYDYAFFITFFAYYFLMRSLFDRFLYLPLFFVALFMIILTQSRSVVAGFLVSFFVLMPLAISYFGFTLKTFRLNKKLIWFYCAFLIIFLLLVVAIPYLTQNFQYLTGQFTRLLETGEIGGSANHRLEQFKYVLDRNSENPLTIFFGNGPAKNEMEYVESIYTYLFFRYGLLGVVLYFFILFMSIIHCFKLVKALSSKSKYYALFLSIFLWLITIPLLSIGNNFTEQTRISFFYYMIVAFTAASYYRFILIDHKN
jgi:hypothetical protein